MVRSQTEFRLLVRGGPPCPPLTGEAQVSQAGAATEGRQYKQFDSALNIATCMSDEGLP